MLRRIIHLRFEKKKHLTSVRSIPEKTSLQEDMGRNENHGCRNPCPFPGKSLKTKEEEHYKKFCEWMKPIFLQIPFTDTIKLPHYSRDMQDIVTNKRKVPNEAISTMLANCTFSGRFLRSLVIQVYPLFLAP